VDLHPAGHFDGSALLLLHQSSTQPLALVLDVLLFRCGLLQLVLELGCSGGGSGGSGGGGGGSSSSNQPA
jgi:hypothetical protein